MPHEDQLDRALATHLNGTGLDEIPHPADQYNGNHRGHDFVPISQHRSYKPQWLWDSVIPLGEMSLLVGQEKAGKSLLCAELVARATRGQLDGDLSGVPTPCLYLTAEDRYDATVKPRLKLAGADLDAVYVEAPNSVLAVTNSAITSAIQDAGVRLVILDPILAFLDGLEDETSDAKVRAAMKPIADVAQRNGASIIALKHVNKTQGRAVMNRVGGSRAYTALVRQVLFAVKDPESEDRTNPDRLIFGQGNLSPASVGHRYGIHGVMQEFDDGQTGEVAQIVWKGTSDITADEAFTAADTSEASIHRAEDKAKGRTEIDDALREYLDSQSVTTEAGTTVQGVVHSRDAYEYGSEVLLWSKDQMKHARRRIGGPTQKLGSARAGLEVGWYWCRNDSARDAFRAATNWNES